MTHNLANLPNPHQGHVAPGSEFNNAIKVLGRRICKTADVAFVKSQMQRELNKAGFVDLSLLVVDTERLPAGNKMIFPVSKIPNILDSFVEIDGDNELHAKHGLKKRLPSILHLAANAPTRSMNRYVRWIQFKLNQLTLSGSAFWELALRVARRSNIFAAIMLSETNPHWHREYNMKQLYILINYYNIFWSKLPTELKFKRTYIPKKFDENGNIIKYRPLGVPTVAWRNYLHTWQQFLMIFLRDRISQHQHGFYKGRGTKTAWEEILTKVINQRDIFEFDLKGFFPSVNTSFAAKLLHRYGMPRELSENLAEMSLSYPRPETLDEGILDETNAIFKHELDCVGLLRWPPEPRFDPKQFQELFMDDEGNYTGKVLTQILNDVKTVGQDSYILRMQEFMPDYSSSYIKSNWFPVLYEWFQIESALKESAASVPSTPRIIGRKAITRVITPEATNKSVLDRIVKLLSSADDTKGNVFRRESIIKVLTNSDNDLGLTIDFFLNYFSNIERTNYVKSVLNTQKQLLVSSVTTETTYEYEYEEIQNPVRAEASKEASVVRAKGTAFYPFLPTSESDFKLVNETQVEGFPQGSPISPLLCSLVLQQTLFDQGQCTMYADDGLFHGDLESPGKTTQMMKYFGLSFADDKSGWVKKDGVWLKPLKFLGLEFDAHGNEGLGQLRASTRAGATLVFDKEQLIVDLMSRLSPEALSKLPGPLPAPSGETIFYESSDSVNMSKQAAAYFQEFKVSLQKKLKTKDLSSDELVKFYLELQRDPKYIFMDDAFSYWSHKLDMYVSDLCDKLDLWVHLAKSQKESTYPHKFDWSLLVKSGQFGFVQSRLYQDSWNSDVEQDFRLSYKPYSWTWFAHGSLIDMSMTSDKSYPSEFSEDITLGNKFPELETTFFNNNISKKYGYEDVGTFYELGFLEFFRVLGSKASEDQAIKNRLKIIVSARFNKALPNEEGHPGFRRFLTVFNSTSHAFPCLVNIFRIQRHLDEWRKILADKFGLKGKTLRKAVQHLRLGYKPEVLYQQLITNPTMLDHIPSPWSVASYYEPIR